MPWRETCPMEEREKFIGELLAGHWTMAEVCRRYGISRKTGYKFWGRFMEGGVLGLRDLSRAPHRPVLRIAPAVEELIVELRRRCYGAGARKIRRKLFDLDATRGWPAASSIGALLKRRGLIVERRRRRFAPDRGQALMQADAPNVVWCADFKGWFHTGDGRRCEPLTVTDAYSRYLLRCQTVRGTNRGGVEPWFDATFREYGLPQAIRTDNGAPFATRGLTGLSRMTVRWIKLGILHERIRPGHPEQNGRHERFHRTLKEATVSPAAGTIAGQQQAFDRFRVFYNEHRPHESLEQRTPGELYRPSPRVYPRRVPTMEYGDAGEIRRVRHKGEIKWRGQRIFLSEVLHGEPVRLEQVDDRYWRIYFGAMALVMLDDWKGRLLPLTASRLEAISNNGHESNEEVLPMSPV